MSIIRFKPANCKNCYKCIRSCPVKAIALQHDQAEIMEDACILCGNCLAVCPQNAKSVKNDVETVQGMIRKKEKVYVSLAPSFIASFQNPDEHRIFSAIRRLGFTHVEETAVGAAQVSRQYERLLGDRKMKNIITTCCPSVTLLVEKYYPDLIDQLAPVVSPMIAHSLMLRETYGSRIRVVFIGPCISKKHEGRDPVSAGAVDAVITFEELENWMSEEGISFDDVPEDDGRAFPETTARIYPVAGGILKTIDKKYRRNYKHISVDGIDRCMTVLEAIRNEGLENYFIEMSSCLGSCIGGPCIGNIRGGFLEARDRLIQYLRRSPRTDQQVLRTETRVAMAKTFLDRSKVQDLPEEHEIREILRSIGKFSPAQELNCGACGYTSCREKAIAVFHHKAQRHMCLPFMRERAESLSNVIINTTPHAIFATNCDFLIQEANNSARSKFRLENEPIENKHIFEVLPCEDFLQVLGDRGNIYNMKHYYEQYDMTVEQSVIYVAEHNIVVIIIKDISVEEKKHQDMCRIRETNVEIAQKVIEKQMRVAQEIASLLGETTAETKVALTRLKKSIMTEMDDGR